MHIGSVKFATQLKESPCSPVVIFPSFGSEGHGVEFAQVDSFCRSTLRQGAGDSTSKGRVCSFTGQATNVFVTYEGQNKVIDRVYVATILLY